LWLILHHRAHSLFAIESYIYDRSSSIVSSVFVVAFITLASFTVIILLEMIL